MIGGNTRKGSMFIEASYLNNNMKLTQSVIQPDILGGDQSKNSSNVDKTGSRGSI